MSIPRIYHIKHYQTQGRPMRNHLRNHRKNHRKNHVKPIWMSMSSLDLRFSGEVREELVVRRISALARMPGDSCRGKIWGFLYLWWIIMVNNSWYMDNIWLMMGNGSLNGFPSMRVSPKWLDGWFQGKSRLQMDDLEGTPMWWKNGV